MTVLSGLFTLLPVVFMGHHIGFGSGRITRTLGGFVFALMGLGFAMPNPASGALYSESVAVKMGHPALPMDRMSVQTWSAFHSSMPRNVCVQVTNSGTQEMTVWLFDSQTMVGLFTVLPRHISAMCTVANKIEFGCTGDSCQSPWTVFDAP